MTYYDIMFEAINNQYKTGLISFEQASELNSLTYNKYISETTEDTGKAPIKINENTVKASGSSTNTFKPKIKINENTVKNGNAVEPQTTNTIPNDNKGNRTNLEKLVIKKHIKF